MLNRICVLLLLSSVSFGAEDLFPVTGRYAENTKSTASNVTDLTRIGCKLRPDLGSGVNTPFGVITCWHCVSSGKPIEVECDGEVGRGTVITKDEAADVALIAVPWTRQHPTVDLATNNSLTLMTLVARSSTGKIDWWMDQIIGDSFDGMKIVAQPSIAGQSGGGYIDAEGKLAGIVSGNIVDREPFRGLMIPASAIRRILPANAVRQAAGANEAAPTPYAEIERVLNLLPKPQRGFVDFGCGADARWCIAAAEKWQCKCVGMEIDPTRAKLAQERVKAEGFADLIEIYCADSTAYSYPNCDVGVAFLFQGTLDKLKPKIEGLTAFASYMHQPPVPATKSGDSWIYRRPAMTAQSTVPMVNYGGQLYAGRVCSDPRCGMCAAIQSGLAQAQQQQSSTPRGQHVETRRVKVCNGKACWWEDRQVLVND